jgi:hypothetical protein
MSSIIAVYTWFEFVPNTSWAKASISNDKGTTNIQIMKEKYIFPSY